jgi:hypothetical protein
MTSDSYIDLLLSDQRASRHVAASSGDIDPVVDDSVVVALHRPHPVEQLASFDYCFNYFQSFRERGYTAAIADDRNRQLSCLQLGFYLASWGMLRGSTDLLQRSVKQLVPLIEVIAGAPVEMWAIDADCYGEKEWAMLRDFGREMRAALPGATSDTLVTKIMLGVFGNVPAFDSYFKRGSGLSVYGHSALQRVERFYRENAESVDRHRVHTLDFDSGTQTSRIYTRAKVIDMIFFIAGMQ